MLKRSDFDGWSQTIPMASSYGIMLFTNVNFDSYGGNRVSFTVKDNHNHNYVFNYTYLDTAVNMYNKLVNERKEKYKYEH